MEKLSTHVLDTASGRPAAGVCVRVFREGRMVMETRTNADGRCDAPLLVDPIPGPCRLVFSIGAYFRETGVESPFLEDVPIDFIISTGQSYHVPLLVSPWSYSTYRCS